MQRIFLIVVFIFSASVISSQRRWQVETDGSILWKVEKGESHSDNIEMSGQYISSIITYGVDEKGRLILNRQLVFPMLRTIPNDTHASLIYTFGQESSPVIKINNRTVQEQVTSVRIKGIVEIEGTYPGNVIFKRRIFPSMDKAACIEQFILQNRSGKDIRVDVENFEKKTWTHPEKSFYGVYELTAGVNGSGIHNVKTGDSLNFSVCYSGRKKSEPEITVDADRELEQREAFVGLMFGNLKFTCPDTVLCRMFDFAKIRAMESLFRTKGGLVHSPGGGAYYAAIWANDQAEYANPFFAYTGYPLAIEAGRTAWSWFARYMNPEYKPIPSSIIAEGTGFWNGAGDRGDQAMIAYGASRFALALGDIKTAEELWPLIEWCIEYSRRKMTPEGVIASDSDELEGRFPAGKANLCTSSLLYDALVSASYLSKDLGKPRQVTEKYSAMAKSLKAGIENYFGAEMNGFHTYRYYDGNNVLRSWICIPLTMGIFDRAEGTTLALFSPDLWTEQGLLTQAGTTTFWDRSTLYGLRGVIAAGSVDKALPFLISYSNKRLLGEHVPYAVEAWPEGNQRHLSAESALYCRIFTEGLFGYRPTGLNSFALTPQLPGKWNEMSLQNLVVCGGKNVDVSVSRKENKIRVRVASQGFIKEYLVKEGRTIEVKFK